MASTGLSRSQELIQKSRQRAMEETERNIGEPQPVEFKHLAAKDGKKKKKGIKKILKRKKKKNSKAQPTKVTGTDSASVSSLGSKSSRGSDRKLEEGTPSLSALASIEDSVGLKNLESTRNVDPVEEVEEEEDKSEEVVFETEENPSGGEDAAKNATSNETEKNAEEKKTDDTQPAPRVFRKKHPTLSRSQELILESRERHKQQKAQNGEKAPITAPITTVHVAPEKTVSVPDDQSEASRFSRCCRRKSKRRDSFEVS